jgi:hypothetical protein
MLILHAAREVCEEEGFDEVLDSVRDRVDAIESLHRTRELTVRSLIGARRTSCLISIFYRSKTSRLTTWFASCGSWEEHPLQRTLKMTEQASRVWCELGWPGVRSFGVIVRSPSSPTLSLSCTPAFQHRLLYSMAANTTSVLIVGAGCFGVSTAYHLLKRGYTDVTVLDRSPTLPAPDAASTDINKSAHIACTLWRRVVSEDA